MNVLRKPFRYSFFNATWILIGINFVVYAAIKFVPWLAQYLSLTVYGFGVKHYLWQPLSYMFLHKSFSQFFFTMFGIFVFGSQVEHSVGSKEFFLIFFLCGILNALLSVLILYISALITNNVQLLWVQKFGADGILYTLLFMYAVIFPNNVIYIWGILPIQSPLLVLLYVILMFVDQIVGVPFIVTVLSLLGFFIAWAYMRIRMGVSPIKIWKQTFRK